MESVAGWAGWSPAVPGSDKNGIEYVGQVDA